MVRRFSVCSFLLGLVACSILLALPLCAAAGICNSGDSQITTSQYTGPIDLGCGTGDIKVKIVVNYNFGVGCSGTVTFYRCGASSNIYNFTVCDVTYIVGVQGTWADGLADCSRVTPFPEQ